MCIRDSLTTVPKIGALVAVYRLMAMVSAGNESWLVVVAVLATASMFLGNLAAYWQRDPRRLLGWSTVSQVGFLLVPVAAAGRSDLALPSLLFYLAAYALTNVAAFAVTAALPEYRDLTAYRGLARARPGLALALLVALLGLVGTPPTAVFRRQTHHRHRRLGRRARLAGPGRDAQQPAQPLLLPALVRPRLCPSGAGLSSSSAPGRGGHLARGHRRCRCLREPGTRDPRRPPVDGSGDATAAVDEAAQYCSSMPEICGRSGTPGTGEELDLGIGSQSVQTSRGRGSCRAGADDSDPRRAHRSPVSVAVKAGSRIASMNQGASSGSSLPMRTSSAAPFSTTCVVVSSQVTGRSTRKAPSR